MACYCKLLAVLARNACVCYARLPLVTSVPENGRLKSGYYCRLAGELSNEAAKKCWCSLDLTLKALANSSPGVCFETLGVKIHVCFVATLKELRRVFGYRDATLSGFVSSVIGLKLANAFSVNLKLHQYRRRALSKSGCPLRPWQIHCRHDAKQHRAHFPRSVGLGNR